MHSFIALVVSCVILAQMVVGMAEDVNRVIKDGMYVVDTDSGTDDAMAILMLLNAEQKYYNTVEERGPRVLAITAVNGNTALDNVTLNVLKVLEMKGRLDIPVYRGAEVPLVHKQPATGHYGTDGLGDLPWENPPSRDLLQKEHAVLAMLRYVDQYPGKITLLALGPLTNVALATRLDPKFISKLNRLIIMGGAVEGAGNVKPGVEFNFYMDPAANYVLFEGSVYENDKVYLLPWETITKLDISRKWRQEVLGSINSVHMKFLNAAEANARGSADIVWAEADPLAVAVALIPSLAIHITRHHIVTVMHGPTSGGISVDYGDTLLNRSQANIYLNVDAEAYKTFLFESFN